MKKSGIIFFASLLVCTASLFAQSTQINIIGSIENASGETIKLYKTGMFGSDSASFATINEEGIFTMNFSTEKSGYYLLRNERNYYTLYLEPGKSYAFKGDAEKLDETIEFSGKEAKVNNYFLAKEKVTLPGSKDLYGSSLIDFERHLDNYSSEAMDLLNKNRAYLPKELIELEEAGVKNTVAKARFTYPQYYGYFHDGKEFKDSTGEYMDMAISAVNLDKPEWLKQPAYRQAMQAFINYHVSEEEKANENVKAKEHYKLYLQYLLVRKYANNTEVSDYLYTAFLMEQVKYNGIDGMLPFLQKHKGMVANSNYTRLVMEEMKPWRKIAKGMDAPNFEFVSLDGEKVSLESFKGKYLYIDVWATWCGPCKAEIPHLKEVQEACKDYNIQFLQVSLDTDQNAWKKMVAEKGVSGTHLFANGWDNTLVKEYNIKSIPRFILIDPQGKIISAVAPRPSEDIKAVIDSLEGIEG